MNWSEFGDAGETTTARAAEQLCPEGTHVAEIGWVDIQPKDWAKSPTNKDGTCLGVRLDIAKGIKAVFDWIPCDRRGSIEALCRSARVEPPRTEWDETCLKGQMVTVETVIALSKAGNDYVKVVKYKPNAETLPQEVRERPARTPTQKADAATKFPDDDIPF